LDAGAVHDTCACEVAGIALTPVGAPGGLAASAVAAGRVSISIVMISPSARARRLTGPKSIALHGTRRSPANLRLRYVLVALRGTIHTALRRLARRNPTKESAELAHWQSELAKLRRWFVDGTTDWWGLPAPAAERKVATSDLWPTNAILTMHRLRPAYWEELQLEEDAFRGRRVLEVGCGPLAPILQFEDCERYGVDPLIDAYVGAGWPLYDLDVTFVNAPGEGMPFPDGWFDAVISVNALDHVDDFAAVAGEIERVVKTGGQIRFEVEYHEPTVTEPLKLDDDVVAAAFGGTALTKVRELDAGELFGNLVRRFGLQSEILPALGSGERYALWDGIRGVATAAEAEQSRP
jgi:SAM-dependent methyltransferase